MNASDILKYGHLTVHGTLERVPQAQWNTAGVCGYWSVRQILAHLASFELALVDILRVFPEQPQTPLFTSFLGSRGTFNDDQVDLRDGYSPAETLAELDEAHAAVMPLIADVPADLLRKAGAIPWYGAEYALDDFLVYSFYGHKREHSAQIAVFADTLS
jgi:hypothetical protein